MKFRWLWAYAIGPTRCKDSTPPNIVQQGGWLDCHGFYQPNSYTHLLKNVQNQDSSGFLHKLSIICSWETLGDVRSIWYFLWYFQYFIYILAATSATFGGTISKCRLVLFGPSKPSITPYITKRIQRLCCLEIIS